MNLNHMNLTVPNVATAKVFFETHFNFKCIEVKGDNVLAVLNDDNGFVFTLMSETFNKNGITAYPQNFHFGFILSSKEDVSTLFKQLKDAGVTLEHEPSKSRNSFGFYFYFDNLFIEIGHYMNE